VTGRRGRSHKQLLHDLKEIIGYRKLKKEALDRTLCGLRFGRNTFHKTDYGMNKFDIARAVFLATLMCVSNSYYYSQCGI
jgi:hypothetical protein